MSMADVLVYTTTTCPYCVRAKALLQQKGVDYREVDVTDNPALREKMTAESGGRRTVPQVFIDGKPIGGYDDLKRLDDAGDLDRLLGAAPPG